MPGKKKKGALRPTIHPQDSMRRDIEAARSANLQAISSNESGPDAGLEDGLDVADELMATLEARDKAPGVVPQGHIQTNTNTLPIPNGRPSKSSVSGGSGPSETSTSTSPRRSAGEVLKEAGEKLFGHHSPRSPNSLSASPSADDDKLASDMHSKGSIRERLFGSSPSNKTELEESADSARRKVPRQKARKERKAAEQEAQRVQAELELKANGGKPDPAEKERVAITDLCRALHVEMKEITPDGHCLYAAVADQLNLLGKNEGKRLTYQDTRKATASFMRNHADDFMPFISDFDEHMAGIENKEAGSQEADDASKQQKHFMKYCDAVESTGVWGGQPEILALSRAYGSPVHVVQAGSPVVKVGAEESKGEPLMISYHRRMYGLGEHYNSLHKVSH